MTAKWVNTLWKSANNPATTANSLGNSSAKRANIACCRQSAAATPANNRGLSENNGDSSANTEDLSANKLGSRQPPTAKWASNLERSVNISATMTSSCVKLPSTQAMSANTTD